MPPIGLITGGVDFKDLFVALDGKDYVSLATAKQAGAATLNYGVFINAVINFLIVAFVVFLVIKNVNRFAKKKEEAPAAPAPPPQEVVLLSEIRDILSRR
jgi:large conductance mechanosensitive channel